MHFHHSTSCQSGAASRNNASIYRRFCPTDGKHIPDLIIVPRRNATNLGDRLKSINGLCLLGDRLY